ncbi:MAG: efflux RND transporter permease subunit [Saprospiraceae bacterium]|nr:efflux RND transporter permease subunit [Saprospiraceae bacterium]
MEKKIIFGTLGGMVAGSVVAMAIFMGLLGGMTEAWAREFASCLKPMDPTWWLVASLLFSLFNAILLHKFGVSTLKGGAFAGGWIAFFIALWYGLFNASTFTAYTWEWLPLDVLGNTLAGVAGGAAIGWIYGRMK